MSKLLPAALALCVLVAGCNGASANAQSRITELHALDVKPGANQISGFLVDGRAGLIVQGWRDLGDSKGYRIYSVLIPSTDPLRGWDLAVIKPVPAEAPSDAEILPEDTQVAGTVRFAHGYLDGNATTFMITAKRDETVAAGKPGKVEFEVYRLSSGRTDGGSENVFEPMLHEASKHDFCNPDMALAREFGLKLPGTYTGVETSDGCPRAA